MLILIFFLAQTGRIATRKYVTEVAGYGPEVRGDMRPAYGETSTVGRYANDEIRFGPTLVEELLFLLGSHDPCAVFSHGSFGVCFADLDSIDIITAFDIHIESE